MFLLKAISLALHQELPFDLPVSLDIPLQLFVLIDPGCIRDALGLHRLPPLAYGIEQVHELSILSYRDHDVDVSKQTLLEAFV